MTTTTNHHHHTMCHTARKSFSVHAKKFRRVISWIFNFKPWHMHTMQFKTKIELKLIFFEEFFFIHFSFCWCKQILSGTFFVLCIDIYDSVLKLTENCVGLCKIRSNDTSNQYGAKLGRYSRFVHREHIESYFMRSSLHVNWNKLSFMWNISLSSWQLELEQ